MKVRTVVLLGLIVGAALAIANAKDLQRYLRLRNM
ncbi:MAG: DUF6893 family small protein [Candidatus Dormibacteraceae bacterium]